jgi:hypothetical protein
MVVVLKCVNAGVLCGFTVGKGGDSFVLPGIAASGDAVVFRLQAGVQRGGRNAAAFCRQWGGLLMWRATAVDWLAGCLWRSDAATFCHQVGP